MRLKKFMTGAVCAAMLISGSGIGNLTSYAEEVTEVSVQEELEDETEYEDIIQLSELEETNNTILNSYGSSYIQSGTQNAINSNMKNPLSAWKTTNATYRKGKNYNEIPYSIRLEELYYGDEASEIVSSEAVSDIAQYEGQQWIVMKFYLSNLGNETIEARDIIHPTVNFYSSNGASMTIVDSASFLNDRRNQSYLRVKLNSGESSYVWVGFLTHIDQGLPLIKINNGYNDDSNDVSTFYTWINTDPNYKYDSNKVIKEDDVKIDAVKAVNDNFDNPLSAWSTTLAYTHIYQQNRPYYIRLVEMHTGDDANKIMAEENSVAPIPTDTQQWILMKFYLKNAGDKPISKVKTAGWASNDTYYKSDGNPMNIIAKEAFLGERDGMNDINLEGGADGYFWVNILVEKADGLPYIKIINGIPNKKEYSWLNTDKGYVYTPPKETTKPQNNTTIDGTKFSDYQGYSFYKDSQDNVRCYDAAGNPVINDFKCDGTYTYYFQLDGTAMKDRLTYHPDGIHVIYFDSEGHEVFSDFAHVKKSISGDAVDDYCFFNVFGYMYVDVLTWDKSGTVLYYANPYGVLERNGAFTFSETVQWADGTPCVGIAGGSGYANSDGTVEIR